MRIDYFVLPLLTFTAILVGLLGLYDNRTAAGLFVVVGLVFSVIGDVFNVQAQVAYGLAFFILAHVSYMAAFSLNTRFKPRWVMALIPASVMALILAREYPVWFTNMDATMKAAVPVYMVFVTLMATFATGMFACSPSPRTALIALGGIAFWVSDICVALSLFEKNELAAKFVVWLYVPAQLAIASLAFRKKVTPKRGRRIK